MDVAELVAELEGVLVEFVVVCSVVEAADTDGVLEAVVVEVVFAVI